MGVRTYTLKSSSAAPRLRIDYRGQLNDEQLAVVEAAPAPALVIAGAGSGKTRTLTFRVARLLELGCPPEGMLLLTFTNKAAKEMLKRVAELCGGLTDVRRIAGGTFHAVAHRLLREHAPSLGYARTFGLLDREDSRDLMASCLTDLNLPVGSRRFPKAEVVVDIYSMAVNTQRTIPEIVARYRTQFEPVTEELVKAASRYLQRKLEMQLMDFDDLLLNWKRLLTDHPAVRERLQGRFQAILVDEYQDTNRLQGDVVDLLAAGQKNLTVVGDDAQSIYSFRGADFTNIIEFPARYPGCQVFKLTQNYRSSPEILTLANASIALNRRQFKKDLVSTRQKGIVPALVPLRDVNQQAEFIAQRVLELRDEGVSLSQQAVLYRAHHHSMELQLELARRGVPFVVRSGVRFLEQAHIKDVMAHLRFVNNPRDELAFKRVIKLFPGIGGGLAADLWNLLGKLSTDAGPLTVLCSQRFLEEVPRRSQPGVARAATLISLLSDPKLAATPGELILRVLHGGYGDYLRENFPNGESRSDDLTQLAEYAAQFHSLEEFLGEVTLLSEFQAEDLVDGARPDEQLTLSSVHQAKGLEWRVVYVAGLADGRFPMYAATRDPDEEEEERRLFYVAATRARDELYLTYPLVASPREGEQVLLRVSRFVEELPSGPQAPYDRVQVEVAPPEALPPPRQAGS